jgi:ribosomal protein L19
LLCLISKTGRKKLKIYPPPPTPRANCKDPVAALTESQLAALDPTGERRALFDYRRNPRSVKVGDILRVTFKNGDPFSGVCLSIRLRGIDTSFLLRNELTRVGVEMAVKVFSPNVESVEVVQRTEKRKRRARLYYMRYVPASDDGHHQEEFSSSAVKLMISSLDFTGSPGTIWEASRTSCRTTCGRSRFLQVSVQPVHGDGDGELQQFLFCLYYDFWRNVLYYYTCTWIFGYRHLLAHTLRLE